MQYRSVKLPSDFIAEVKKSADKEYRSIAQQLLYWANLGKQIASNNKSYVNHDEDIALGKLALERYNQEKQHAFTVDINEL